MDGGRPKHQLCAFGGARTRENTMINRVRSIPRAERRASWRRGTRVPVPCQSTEPAPAEEKFPHFRGTAGTTGKRFISVGPAICFRAPARKKVGSFSAKKRAIGRLLEHFLLRFGRKNRRILMARARVICFAVPQGIPVISALSTRSSRPFPAVGGAPH